MKTMSQWMCDVLSDEDMTDIDRNEIDPRHVTRLDQAIMGKLHIMVDSTPDRPFKMIHKIRMYRYYANL